MVFRTLCWISLMWFSLWFESYKLFFIYFCAIWDTFNNDFLMRQLPYTQVTPYFRYCNFREKSSYSGTQINFHTFFGKQSIWQFWLKMSIMNLNCYWKEFDTSWKYMLASHYQAHNYNNIIICNKALISDFILFLP